MSKKQKNKDLETENQRNTVSSDNEKEKDKDKDKITQNDESKKTKLPKWAKKTLITVIAVILSIVVLAFAGSVVVWRVYMPELGYLEFLDWVKIAVRSQVTSGQTLENEIVQTQKDQIDNINKYTNLNITEEIANELNNGNLTESEIVDKLLGKEPAVSEEHPASDSNSEEQPDEQPDEQDSQQDSSNGQGDKSNDKTNGDGKGEQTNPPTPNQPSQPSVQPQAPTSKPPDAQSSNPSQSGENNPSQNETFVSNKPSYSKNDEKIAQLVAKMYVLKSQYTSQVQGIVNKMLADFAKLPPEERTTGAKTAIAQNYLGTINSLEAQCDAQVNAVVTELRAVLKESGGDMALVNAIEKAYADEKESTKAYYLNKYS